MTVFKKEKNKTQIRILGYYYYCILESCLNAYMINKSMCCLKLPMKQNYSVI